MSSAFDLYPPPNPPEAHPPYTAQPVTVTLTFVLLIFFFAGFCSIFLYRFFMGYTANFLDYRHNAARPTVSTGNGLDPAIIATFPKIVYSSVKDLRQDKCGLECAVCLSEFEDNDELRLLTLCNHVFHPDCIDLWFENHTTCPLCRSSLIAPEANVTDPPENEQQEIEAREDNNSVSMKEDEEEEHEEVIVVVVEGDNHEGATSSAMASQDERQHGEEEEHEEVMVVVVEGGDNHEGATSGAMASQDGGHGEEVADRFRFSRCHSTGHSIVHVEPDDDRYTLRLPDHHHIKDQIAKGHNWTGSCTTFGEFSGNAGSAKPNWLNCQGFPAVM